MKESYPVRRGLKEVVRKIVTSKALCEAAGKHTSWIPARMNRTKRNGKGVYFFSENDCALLNAAMKVLAGRLREITLPLDQKRDPISFYKKMRQLLEIVNSRFLYEELGMSCSLWNSHLCEGDERYWFSYQEIATIQGMVDIAAEKLEGITLEYEPLDSE